MFTRSFINQAGDDSLAGDFENYFAIKPHGKQSTPVDAMRFSLQHQNPLVAGGITGGRSLDNKHYSMLTLSDSNVIAWALKPAEEGIEKGIILRAWNVCDKDKEVSFSTRLPLARAYKTTHIETADQEIPVGTSSIQTIIGHHKMQTFRLVLQ